MTEGRRALGIRSMGEQREYRRRQPLGASLQDRAGTPVSHVPCSTHYEYAEGYQHAECLLSRHRQLLGGCKYPLTNEACTDQRRETRRSKDHRYHDELIDSRIKR